MEITLTLKDLGFILIVVGVVVFIFYAISLLKNLIITVRHTNKILQDTSVISDIAAQRAKDVEKVIGQVTESVGSMAEIIKGNQSTISALTAIINSLVSLKNLVIKK